MDVKYPINIHKMIHDRKLCTLGSVSLDNEWTKGWYQLSGMVTKSMESRRQWPLSYTFLLSVFLFLVLKTDLPVYTNGIFSLPNLLNIYFKLDYIYRNGCFVKWKVVVLKRNILLIYLRISIYSFGSWMFRATLKLSLTQNSRFVTL